MRGLDDFDVFVPRENTMAGRNVCMAHELGHYVLHYMRPALAGKIDGPAAFSRYDIGRAEAEASYFMAELLMPADLFRAAWTETRAGEDSRLGLLNLGEALDVPPAIAASRAIGLGLGIC